MEAMMKLCKQLLEGFNTAGRADKINKVLSPAEKPRRYANGELAPKVA
jgi:fructose-bisphosphate aldolase class II